MNDQTYATTIPAAQAARATANEAEAAARVAAAEAAAAERAVQVVRLTRLARWAIVVLSMKDRPAGDPIAEAEAAFAATVVDAPERTPAAYLAWRRAQVDADSRQERFQMAGRELVGMLRSQPTMAEEAIAAACADLDPAYTVAGVMRSAEMASADRAGGQALYPRERFPSLAAAVQAVLDRAMAAQPDAARAVLAEERSMVDRELQAALRQLAGGTAG